eukprot:TRINITY_DN1626_c0_g1_i1.p1 TRINITY_DN1626_c0_g1~~TRINITY_DN1626_c0_g1_i1.p1  ORF type:complete len:458 (+),score=147.24 TRINITY_DN1626_c0_g1_i1:145-1374(+)
MAEQLQEEFTLLAVPARDPQSMPGYPAIYLAVASAVILDCTNYHAESAAAAAAAAAAGAAAPASAAAAAAAAASKAGADAAADATLGPAGLEDADTPIPAATAATAAAAAATADHDSGDDRVALSDGTSGDAPLPIAEQHTAADAAQCGADVSDAGRASAAVGVAALDEDIGVGGGDAATAAAAAVAAIAVAAWVGGSAARAPDAAAGILSCPSDDEALERLDQEVQRFRDANRRELGDDVFGAETVADIAPTEQFTMLGLPFDFFAPLSFALSPPVGQGAEAFACEPRSPRPRHSSAASAAPTAPSSPARPSDACAAVDTAEALSVQTSSDITGEPAMPASQVGVAAAAATATATCGQERVSAPPPRIEVAAAVIAAVAPPASPRARMPPSAPSSPRTGPRTPRAGPV